MNTIPLTPIQPVCASANSEAIQYAQVSRVDQETSERQTPNSDAADVKGKHIAQRSVSQWVNYGKPEDWDREFEAAVLKAVRSIKKGSLDSKNIIKFFQKVRFKIASKRENICAERFGERRDYHDIGSTVLHYTKMYRTHPAYGYALERAVKIPYDKKYFLELESDIGRYWSAIAFFGSGAKSSLRYGLVLGYINDKSIPLTQYVFCQKSELRCDQSEVWFGEGDENFIGENKESGLWIHAEREQIPAVLSFIESLIDKAFNGNLTVIPRIHWWYVHLAPTSRGSGGTAEMITNTLCRLHGVDLPPWKEGVAPSIEVLLEPNEEKFCANYHELFAFDREDLKELFKSTD